MSDNNDFAQRLDAIEGAYEFMLAYAAQGRDTDVGAATSPSIREVLKGLLDALRAVAGTIEAECREPSVSDLARIVEADSRTAAVSVAAALECPAISSQLVDNLNASIHLRAALTGLFLVDEILKLRASHTP